MLGIKLHVLKLRNLMVMLSRTLTHSLMQFHPIFTQFWLFQPLLGQFKHVWYQNACTQADKFNGDTFTQFHVLPHAISRNFHAFSCIFMQFWLFQPFLGQFQHVWYQNA